jgi:predicted DNA-binding transcriptional regulator
MKKDLRGHTRLPNWLLRKGSPATGTRLLVLAYLWSRADSGLQGWPAIDRIAEDLELGERTVKRALLDLEKRGLLARSKVRDSRGQYERTVYQLADLREGPGVKMASGPGATMARGPGAISRGHIQGPLWPTNKPQGNKTQGNNPLSPPASPADGAALFGSEGRKIDPDRDVPGWPAFKHYASRVGISAGEIAAKIFEGVPPAWVLGYLLEHLRKKPRIRKSAAAWLVDKCNRRRAPYGTDYDAAKALLRPYLDRVALPGMIFGDLLPTVEPEKTINEKKREALDGLEEEKKGRAVG